MGGGCAPPVSFALTQLGDATRARARDATHTHTIENPRPRSMSSAALFVLLAALGARGLEFQIAGERVDVATSDYYSYTLQLEVEKDGAWREVDAKVRTEETEHKLSECHSKSECRKPASTVREVLPTKPQSGIRAIRVVTKYTVPTALSREVAVDCDEAPNCMEGRAVCAWTVNGAIESSHCTECKASFMLKEGACAPKCTVPGCEVSPARAPAQPRYHLSRCLLPHPRVPALSRPWSLR